MTEKYMKIVLGHAYVKAARRSLWESQKKAKFRTEKKRQKINMTKKNASIKWKLKIPPHIKIQIYLHESRNSRKKKNDELLFESAEDTNQRKAHFNSHFLLFSVLIFFIWFFF